jgi:hypothetical protein
MKKDEVGSLIHTTQIVITAELLIGIIVALLFLVLPSDGKDVYRLFLIPYFFVDIILIIIGLKNIPKWLSNNTDGQLSLTLFILLTVLYGGLPVFFINAAPAISSIIENIPN